MKKPFKRGIFLLVFFGLFFSGFSSIIVNQNGDFSVQIPEKNKQIFNDNIQVEYSLIVQNNLEIPQEISLEIPEVSGWDVLLSSKTISLEPKESKDVKINFKSNSNFDYGKQIQSSDTVLIGRVEDYRGFFKFPVSLKTVDDSVQINFQVEIISKKDVEPSFIPKISTLQVSPESPLVYSVEAKDLFESSEVSISLELAGTEYNFKDSFSSVDNYKVYTYPISLDLSPGDYTVIINVRHEEGESAKEWFTKKEISILPFKNLETQTKEEFSFYKKSSELTIKNNGNIEDVFTFELDASSFSSLFFFGSFDYSFQDGKISSKISLAPGESKTLEYGFNYLSLYLFFLLVLLLLGYIVARRISNPLDVEVDIYDVKKTQHEGIKSLKIKIGFENIKEKEIDDLKMYFKLPSYLHVDESSFLLSPPKKVLKGSGMYKLLWEFKRFENGDSRILGFRMVNSKGVLGDIRFEDLEFEIKVNGKVRRHKVSLPIIRG
jgi:hypothetical protein